MTAVMDLLDAALTYAARGWPVFPCDPRTKRPLLPMDRDADNKPIKGTGGVKKASTDADQIRAWWSKWPHAMIGVAVGAARLLVIDFDPRTDAIVDEATGEVIGEEVWTLDRLKAALADQAGAALPDTLVGVTRSGGEHHWFHMPAGDAIYAARAVKPVIAVVDPYCFSAAYWLSTQASKFYVTTSGEVGSVGVRSGHTDMSGFEDKIGVKTTLIASSPDKIAGHPHAPLSDEDRAEIQSCVHAASRRFMLAIARGRGMRLADVARVHGAGRTFSAPRALANGAIDGIATMRDVIGRHGSGQVRLALMRRQAALAAMMAGI